MPPLLAALATPLTAETSKGYALLAKLGWNKGSGLGRDGRGVAEPLAPTARTARAGLGVDEARRTREAAQRAEAEEQGAR